MEHQKKLYFRFIFFLFGFKQISYEQATNSSNYHWLILCKSRKVNQPTSRFIGPGSLHCKTVKQEHNFNSINLDFGLWSSLLNVLCFSCNFWLLSYDYINRYLYFNQDQNLYSVHPFYELVEEDGNTHGVFLLNSNAMGKASSVNCVPFSHK